MRILYTTCFMLLLAILAAAQQRTARRVVSGEETGRQLLKERELGNLYKRAAASRFVVIATVSKLEPVAERGHPPSIDEHIEGVLYTVSVEQTLCRQGDFRPQGSYYESQTAPASLQLFRPYRPYSEDKEVLSLGQRYLLFLVIPDQAQQMEWSKRLTLDPQATYYRGEENARGVIALSQPSPENPNPSQPEVLAKVTQLCDAVHPIDRAEKISRLHSLARSGDPVLEREANIGLEELSKSQSLQER